MLIRERAVAKVGLLLMGAIVLGLFGLWLIIGCNHGWQPKHHVLLVFAVGLVVTARWIGPISSLSLLMLLFSIALPLYLCDLVFAIWNYGTFHQNGWIQASSGENRSLERVRAAKNLGIQYDARSRIEVLEELHAKGVQAYPAVPPIVLVKGWPKKWDGLELSLDGDPILPLGGISNQVTVYCNEAGTYVVYQSDEYGFRNPPGIWHSVPIDVAIIGDSYVLGACVPYGASFPELVRGRYLRTVALGGDGKGPLLELATLREYLPAVRPKVVFWVYYEGNDLSIDLQWEQTSPFLMRYLDDHFTQNLVNKQPQIDLLLLSYIERVKLSYGFLPKAKQYGVHFLSDTKTFIEELEWIMKLQHLRDYLQQNVIGAVEEETGINGMGAQQYFPAAKADTMSLFRAVLRVSKRTVNSWGGSFIVVYLPQWERYSGKGLVSGDRDQVLEVVRSLDIPVIDLHPRFLSEVTPLDMFPLRLKGHYSIRGNHIVAQEIFRHMENMVGN